MACGALLWSGSINDAADPGWQRACLVALAASHTLVSALELERRLGFVIEIGRFPFFNPVTLCACGRRPTLRELPAVYVCMAARALQGSGRVLDALDAFRGICRHMTFFANNSLMRPLQRELGRRVIKTLQFVPRPVGMACLAPDRLSVIPQSIHSGAKLAVMRILMAGSAGYVLKVVRHWRGRCKLAAQAVAIHTRDRRVRARQRVSGCRMPRDCEGRRLEYLLGVTELAAVLVLPAPELTAMDVLVTGGT